MPKFHEHYPSFTSKEFAMYLTNAKYILWNYCKVSLRLISLYFSVLITTAAGALSINALVTMGVIGVISWSNFDDPHLLYTY